MKVTNHTPGMPHIRATIRKMSELARAAQHTFAVRNLATRITHHVPSKAPTAELRALYTWVRDHIRYRFDPLGLEWVQSPERTVKEAAGDCDDMSTLLAALAGSLGHRWRFRTVGESPNAQRHVQVQAWDGKQWVNLDPVLEPTQPTTAARPSVAGTFGLSARGAEHIWDDGGRMLKGLSGPTSAADRQLWSIVPYFQPAPPWPPYGGSQPPMPGHFPRTDSRYRSADAPGYEGGRPFAQIYRLPVGSVASQGQLAGLGRGRFGRRFRRFAKKAFKGVVATSIPGAGVVMAARKIRKKRGKKRLLPRMLSGPTNAQERELWNWIPYDPTTGGAMAGVPGVVLSFPVGCVDPHGMAGPLGLIPYSHPTLGAGFLRKLKRVAKKVVKKGITVAKKVGKVAKKVVKNPIFQAVALTAAQAIPGAGAAALAAKAAMMAAKVAKGIKTAKAVVKGIKGVKKGVKLARSVARKIQGGKGGVKKLLAAQAKKIGATALTAALPSGKADWKKPHPALAKKYPKNARQLFDPKAGVFRVFVPSAGLNQAKIASMRARGGKAKPRRLAGLGAIRPTISFSLGATASSGASARPAELVAKARQVVAAVETFKRNHQGKPPAIRLPAITAFQVAEKNLTIDGLYGTNTHAAVSWYLQGSGTAIPAYAPGLRTQLTWSPPITALSPVAPTPQPAVAPAPGKPPAAAPVVKPKPPAGASFPAPGGYVEIGAENQNPGLAPAGYTGPGAAPAPSVPGTPVQPGAPTGGAPRPAEAAAVAQLAEEAAQGDEDAAQAVQEATATPEPVAELTPLTPAADPYAPPPSGMPGTRPQAPIIDVWGPNIQPPTPVVSPSNLAPIYVPPELGPLPVVPGPVPAIPITPGYQPAPSSSSGGGSGNAILWASLAYLYFQARKRAA